LFQIGAITPNEIRAKENMNPLDVDEADQTFVMLNLIKLEDSPSAGELGAATPGKTEPDEDVEPEPGSKEGLRRFFMKTENRSIVTRDRIVKRYIPLLRDAAEAVVAKEARTLKSQIGKVDYKTNSIKNLKARRAAISAGLQDFIDDFYKDFPEYIETKMGPVLRALMAAISDEANIEAGTDADISDEVQDYIETFAKRYVYSSHGQLQALFDGDIDALAERVDEWSEKRSNKVVNDESVRASSAAYAFVTFAAGMMLRWRIRGKDTCPYCKSLNGERMAKGGAFVKPGQKIEPNGEPPMRVYGLKQHPPLHQGCDCYVTMF